MSKLTPQKFVIENFASQASWIGPLLSSLNSFFNDLVISSSNKFSIEDNLFQEIKEIKFKNDSNNFPLSFKTKFNVNPKGIILIYNYDNTLATCATQTPVICWRFSNNEIIIDSITGLTASTVYTFRLLVIYG